MSPVGVTDRAEDVHIEALGTVYAVRPDGADAALLRRCLQDAWAWCRPRPDARADVAEVVRVVADPDEETLARARADGALALADVADAMHWVTPAITGRAIAARAGELLMMHASAVADPGTGATAVLVGTSGAGKTTAASTLGRDLWYLTDETVALRPDLRVVPYPKPLSVRSGPASSVKRQVCPGDLGLLRAHGPARVARVLVLDRRPQPCEPHVETLRTVPALAELAPHVSYLTQVPAPLRTLAALLRETGGLRRVTYHEAADLAPLVRDLLVAG